MNRLYFCMIPYYLFYDGTEAPEVPECMNFLPIDLEGEDGSVNEVMFGALTAKKQLPQTIFHHDENAMMCEDVTVVFCAVAPNGAVVTVGWYAHANISRVPEYLPLTSDNGIHSDHPFFFCTLRGNACLLPEEERFRPMWQIPRNKSANKNKFGFSADPFWCAEEPSAAAWKRAFGENIVCYTANGYNMLQDEVFSDFDEGNCRI
ncbi:MAG: hypothetical protein IJC98_00650 [Clostridia bacterium]|nr:hypothetical protein [Clostridia bacterium]